jgi:hypothetical protein
MPKDISIVPPGQPLDRGYFGPPSPHDTFDQAVYAGLAEGGSSESKLSWTKAINVVISRKPKNSENSDAAKDRFLAAFEGATGLKPVFVKSDPVADGTRWEVHYQDVPPDAIAWLGQNFMDYDIPTFGPVDPQTYEVV